jgi:hypothetical protein
LRESEAEAERSAATEDFDKIIAAEVFEEFGDEGYGEQQSLGSGFGRGLGGGVADLDKQGEENVAFDAGLAEICRHSRGWYAVSIEEWEGFRDGSHWGRGVVRGVWTDRKDAYDKN